MLVELTESEITLIVGSISDEIGYCDEDDFQVYKLLLDKFVQEEVGKEGD